MITEEIDMPDHTVNNNRDGWVPRTWSDEFDDDEPDDRPAMVDPSGRRWRYEPAADGWMNEHEVEEVYEWSAALFEVEALREVQS